IRALADATGVLTDRYRYSAFGQLQERTGTTVNPYGYTAQQTDTSTGLQYLRARYYNPADGRFLSRDTFPGSFGNPVDLNRYVYVANAPVNSSDPSGLFLIDKALIEKEQAQKAKRTIVVVGLGAAAAIAAIQTLLELGQLRLPLWPSSTQ